MIKLQAPSSYKSLTKEQKALICNGMGARDSVLASMIPNTMYFLDMAEAGNIHDYMYHVGTSEIEKIEADRAFFKQLHQDYQL